jgi:hypothetical protein
MQEQENGDNLDPRAMDILSFDNFKINSVNHLPPSVDQHLSPDFRFLIDQEYGKSAVLFGSGPSIWNSTEAIKKAKDDGMLFFGTNGTLLQKELFTLDYWVCSDKRILKKYPGKIESFNDAQPNKLKIWINPNNRGIAGNRSRQWGRCMKDPECKKRLMHNAVYLKANGWASIMPSVRAYRSRNFWASSIFFAAQTMLIMGIKNIYLIGCDACLSPHAWYGGDNNIKGDRNRKYNRVRPCWRRFGRATKKYFPDVKIHSINPCGLKDMFEENHPYNIFTKKKMM